MKETKDILVTFENLNNHEVFTPPRVARDMLNLLPEEIWSNPQIKLLDPAVKTGVFLRESFYRFFEGLEDIGEITGYDGIKYDLNKQQERINHILKNMLFGIATSELTGYISRRTLYGVMKANSIKKNNALKSIIKINGIENWSKEKMKKYEKSISINDYFDFNIFKSDINYKGFEEEGNIFYPTDEVQKRVIEEDNYELEDSYYPFIEDEVKHKKIKEIKENEMKFDVIIGNPPYQISKGKGLEDQPIYQEFIYTAIKLNPMYLTMIVPSRWMTDGNSTLKKFRKFMLNEQYKNILEIVDYKNAKDCFQSVNFSGGVNYFLWSINGNINTKYTQKNKDKKIFSEYRKLNDMDILIREKAGIDFSILSKVKNNNGIFYDSICSNLRPFLNDPTQLKINKNYMKKQDSNNNLKIYVSNKVSSDKYMYIPKETHISKNKDKVKLHKVLISKAYGGNRSETPQIINKPIYAEPGTISSMTYLLLDSFKTKSEAINLIKYVKTKFFRFMLSLKKNTQNTTNITYSFVPVLPMTEEWTDKKLYKKYNLTQEEIEYIEKSIAEME